MCEFSFSAGAGKAPIILPENIFPTPDGFSGIYDDLYARILVLESGVRFVLVSLDWVMLREEEILAIKEVMAKICAVSLENIWVCTTHTKNSPHFPPLKKRMDDFLEQERYDTLLNSITDAVSAASLTAVSSLKPAVFGTGSCRCLINTNKNIKTKDGWWIGSNDSGNSDPDITIWKIEDIFGKVISVFYICNCQPVVMGDSRLTDGTRLVSADIAGVASRFIEDEYGNGCVALWFTGSSGDQWPVLRANKSVRKKGGNLKEIDLGYNGFMLMELLGTHIGEQVLMGGENIECTQSGEIHLYSKDFSHLGMAFAPQQDICPHIEYTFHINGTNSTIVNYMTVGDSALVGISPEICSNTGKNIKLMSPFQNIGVITFCNGSAKCLAEAEHYQDITYQALNCQFAVGGAEKMFNAIIDELNRIKNSETLP